MKTIQIFLLGLLWLVSFIDTQAQQDTLTMLKREEPKVKRNVVRFNLTNPLIFGDRSFVLGYERVLKSHQSFSVNGGLASLPKFNIISFDEDSVVQLNKSSRDKGFNITGDYRFYLASENRHNAPRGIYVGPYASHVFMGRENTWTLNTESFAGDVNTDLQFRMTAIGAQLGYQFILWKRVALDFVLIGPSIAWYSINAKLDTSLDPDSESELYQKISEILNERFPGFSFAIDDVDFNKTGSTNTQSFGYRYVIHLGYHF